MFTKIVSSLDSSDLRTVGVVILTAFLFQALGLAASAIVALVAPVPKYWLGSLIMACVFSNTTDLPVAYITTLSGGKPFTSEDGSKGVAYSMIFVAVFIFSMFNMGSFRLIGIDAARKTKDIERGVFSPSEPSNNQPGVLTLYSQAKKRLLRRRKRQQTQDESLPSPTLSPSMVGDDKDDDYDDFDEKNNHRLRHRIAEQTPSSTNINDDIPHNLDVKSISDIRETLTTETFLEITRQATGAHADTLLPKTSAATITAASVALPSTWSNKTRARFNVYIDTHPWAYFGWQILYNFSRPPSAMLIISMIITMVRPLRALFYNNSGAIVVSGIPNAPDGQPVLSFIMDFASFVGASQVPFGMMLLGASISRLHVGKLPKGFWRVVLGIALFKLCLLPIIAIVWTTHMQNIGWIDPVKNKMTSLTIIVTAGAPIATLHVLFLSIFGKPTVIEEEDPQTGEIKEVLWFEEMDCLAINVIFQYFVLFVSMGILLTYTLKKVVVV